jgi:pSer/pThr/pTyr-binding forkhead associated (FHA) protein
VRIPKSAARKRRLAVLRQVSAQEAEPGDFLSVPMMQRQEGERFIHACGARLPMRISVRNERTGEREDIFVERPWAVIGGDPKCDIRLLHPDVSQRHAYLQFVGSRVLCGDLGSRTGTHGSSESRLRGWLSADEPLYAGPFSIRLLDNDFDAAGLSGEDAGTADAAPDLSPVFLTFAGAQNNAWGQTTRRITRAVTLVGWNSSCKVRLQHSSVGRAHCSLVLTPDGLWVVDLLCAGGTHVNGKSVEFARLEEGDELAVGRFLMRISYAAPVEDECEPGALDGSPPETPLRGVADFLAPQAVHPHVATPVEFQSIEEVPSAAGPVVEPLPEPETSLTGFRPAALVLPREHALPDAVAQSLTEQFSTMQQQMFNHMQQALAAMTQRLSAAHARQLDLIRKELVRVQEVNGELQGLHGDPAPLAAPRSGTGRPTANALQPPIRGIGPGLVTEAMLSEPESSGSPGNESRESLLSDRVDKLEQERAAHWKKILQILTPADSGASE